MKKILSIILLLAMVFAVTGCGASRSNNKETSLNAESESETVQETEIDYKSLLKDIKSGDTFEFGSYEQDNKDSNGKEPIEWLVLARNGNDVLIISKYAIERLPFQDTYKKEVTWETCSLREWLNGPFINKAFNPNEQKLIKSTTVKAEKNPEYSTNPGHNTTDKVFLLNITEAKKYFGSDRARDCDVTPYAKANGAYGWWYLRSPGRDSFWVAGVNNGGGISYSGFGYRNNAVAVRPAMWISLEPNS